MNYIGTCVVGLKSFSEGKARKGHQGDFPIPMIETFALIPAQKKPCKRFVLKENQNLSITL